MTTPSYSQINTGIPHFFAYKTEAFSFQNNPKYLDLSSSRWSIKSRSISKMDVDLMIVLEEENTSCSVLQIRKLLFLLLLFYVHGKHLRSCQDG